MKRRQRIDRNDNVDDMMERTPMMVLPRTSLPAKQSPRFGTRYQSSRRHVSKGKMYICSVLLAVVLIYGMSILAKNVVFRNEAKSKTVQEEEKLSSLFPREPKLTPGCSVKFQHINMSLCYNGDNTFEDQLGPAVVTRLLEYHFGCTSSDLEMIDLSKGDSDIMRKNRTCFFTSGSLLHFAKTGDHVWGTGMDPLHRDDKHTEWLHIHSLRGPETQRRVKEWYNEEGIPKGDPAFLIPSLYQDYYHLPTKSIGVEPAYTVPRFCFMPRVKDLKRGFIKKPPPDLHVLSVKRQDWQSTMEDFRMCDYVVSSSLYGIVIADALGIPFKWFQFPNATIPDNQTASFEFHDYLKSIGRIIPNPEQTATMAAVKRTSSYRNRLPLDRRKEIAREILASFPYQLFRKSLTPYATTVERPDCHVRFKDKNMALCVSCTGGGFVNEMNVDVVKRLVENRFGCSADKLPIIDIGKRTQETCLLTETLDHASKGDHVWGASATSSSAVSNLRKIASSLNIRSVRGPNTLVATKKRFSSSPNVPLGTPGFLLPYLHRDLLLENGRDRLNSPPRFCYIPGDGDDEQNVSDVLPSGVSLISTTLPSMQALESLQRCDFVFSASFNGIILADALGIPTKWFDHGGEVDSFELKDYFSSTKRDDVDKIEHEFDSLNDKEGYIEPLSLDDRESFADETAATFPFDLFDSQENKTLVIIMGNIRGGELAWESLYKNVLDINSADLALVVGERQPENRTSSLYKRAKYLYEFPEFDDWADAIDLINGTSWRNDLLAYTSREDGLMGAADGRPGSGAVIFCARWYVQKAIEKYGWTDRYDRFILTRADHFYGCAHDLSKLNPLFMWVPEGQAFGGVTDRHLVANSQQIMKALDIYPNPLRYPSKYVDERWYLKNPEKLITNRWKEENLWDDTRRFDRVMFTCADNGDQTRWQGRSEEKAKEGVYLKYVVEYNQTKCVCGGHKWNEPTNKCTNERLR